MDFNIVLLGPTGSGKSTIINMFVTLACQTGRFVCETETTAPLDLPLDPTGVWSEIAPFKCVWPNTNKNQQVNSPIQDNEGLTDDLTEDLQFLKSDEFGIQNQPKVDLNGLPLDPTRLKLLKGQQGSIQDEGLMFSKNNENISLLMRSMLSFLMVVNMLWKLHQTSNPDNEKKNMIEYETNYNYYFNQSPTIFSTNSKMDDGFKSKQLPNYIREMFPTFPIVC